MIDGALVWSKWDQKDKESSKAMSCGQFNFAIHDTRVDNTWYDTMEQGLATENGEDKFVCSDGFFFPSFYHASCP